MMRSSLSNWRLGLWLALTAWGVVVGRSAESPPDSEWVVTQDTVLEPGAVLPRRLVIRASHVVLDGRGATLQGPGKTGDVASLEAAGVGVLVEGAVDVTVKNLKARGFATGLLLRRVEGVSVEGCDFSDNYHDPKFGWGDLPSRGGIRAEQARWCVLRANRANRVWDALSLSDSDDNLIEDNDFGDCSNTCAKLWHASRNRFLSNRLAYGIRIDRAAGEVHARDSTGVLIETGSNDNYWYRNDVTYGGDGIFIRPLNRWVSTGNVFIENDTSYANNNCVESWSPGNVFIRNKANHGSYGFWLGGSDATVLIGNEAAFNGRPDGNHNAPEPGFGHGGIVLVGGSSSHTRIEGNHVHHNHGGGIVFRGDEGSQGTRWKTEHWIVQGNRVESNRFGLWGRWGEGILLAGNRWSANAEGNFLTNVSHVIELTAEAGTGAAPDASIEGPGVVSVGVLARYQPDSAHRGSSWRHLWFIDGELVQQEAFERTFSRPGFHRLGLTVHDGARAALAWRDLVVTRPVDTELGTEGQASDWGFEMEDNANRRGRMSYANEPGGVVGRSCLRFSPDPYLGAYATAIYPAAKNAGWDFSGKRTVSFWIKAQNPNNPGWQNAGPVVRLYGKNGGFEYKPARDGNRLNDPADSEARYSWMRVEIPLSGDAHWARSVQGDMSLGEVTAISIALDSYGYEPFTVWLDGLAVE